MTPSFTSIQAAVAASLALVAAHEVQLYRYSRSVPNKRGQGPKLYRPPVALLGQYATTGVMDKPSDIGQVRDNTSRVTFSVTELRSKLPGAQEGLWLTEKDMVEVHHRGGGRIGTFTVISVRVSGHVYGAAHVVHAMLMEQPDTFQIELDQDLEDAPAADDAEVV